MPKGKYLQGLSRALFYKISYLLKQLNFEWRPSVKRFEVYKKEPTKEQMLIMTGEDKKIEEKWGKRRKLNTSLVSGQRVFIVEIITHTLENQMSFSKEVLSVSLPLFTNFKNC